MQISAPRHAAITRRDQKPRIREINGRLVLDRKQLDLIQRHQAEWGTMTELLRLTGSAAAWRRDLVEHLEVDARALCSSAGRDPDIANAGTLIDRAPEQRRA